MARHRVHIHAQVNHPRAPVRSILTDVGPLPPGSPWAAPCSAAKRACHAMHFNSAKTYNEHGSDTCAQSMRRTFCPSNSIPRCVYTPNRE